MASAFGIAVTNLTSRFGIVSRKAAMRIATETGYKLVDKSREVGRLLNKEEVEQVFETLPKRLRPKIITTREEVTEVLRNQGLSELQIDKELANQNIGAACITNGTKKCPIWLPYERIQASLPKEMHTTIGNSLMAHELEHALEKNNRIIDIFRRKTSKIKEFFGKLVDKNYAEKLSDRGIAIHGFEEDIHRTIQPAISVVNGKPLLDVEPTIESIDKFLIEGTPCKQSLKDRLRRYMRHYAHPEYQGNEQFKRFNLMRYWLDMERPAYQVTAEVDRYALNLQVGENSFHTGVTKGYEAAIDVVKQERRTYWKNKLFGKLKKPIIYTDNKDILKYATTKEDKQIIANLIQGLNKSCKDDFLKVFSHYENQPNVAENIKQFIDKTTVKGKNIIFDDPYLLIFKDIKTLNNPHLIKIMRMANSNIKGADQLHEIISLMKNLDSRQLAIYEGRLAKAIQKEKRIDKICDTLYSELIIYL